jgi:hypothetical protein
VLEDRLLVHTLLFQAGILLLIPTVSFFWIGRPKLELTTTSKIIAKYLGLSTSKIALFRSSPKAACHTLTARACAVTDVVDFNHSAGGDPGLIFSLRIPALDDCIEVCELEIRGRKVGV